MKRHIFSALFLCMLTTSLFAFGAKDSHETVSVGVLTGPSGIPCAHLMEETKTLAGAEVSYQTFAGANLVVPKLVNGEVDIAFLPPNVAAKLYNANNQSLTVIAVCGNGMLSLITKDPSIKSVSDLSGKTVSVAGAGATPEYLTRYVLSQNNVSAELDFSIPNNELAAALINGKISYAVVPEPFATVAQMQDSSIRVALNMQEEFKNISGMENFPMTVIVARKNFAEQNRQIVKAFLSAYSSSLNWTVKNPKLAGEAVERAGLGLKAAVAEKAIPRCAFVYEKPADARKRMEALLNLFLQFAPESVAGKLPDDGFYFK